MKNFYTLLNTFINIHKATTDETEDRINRILSYVKPIYNNYLDAYKKNYDNKKLTDEDKIKHDYKQFQIINDRNQELKSTKKADEIQKPLWVKMNRDNFNSLIESVYNNLNNNEFKTTIDKKPYDLKNTKNLLVKITTQKISKEEALKLYFDLITPYISQLKNTKGKSKNKRNNISNVLENLKSVFNGNNYLHYKDEPSKSESEDVAEKTKLKKLKI